MDPPRRPLSIPAFVGLALTFDLVGGVAALIVLAVIIPVIALRRLFRRIAAAFHDDGRRNVRIVVRPPQDVVQLTGTRCRRRVPEPSSWQLLPSPHHQTFVRY